MLSAQAVLDKAEAVDGYRSACMKCSLNAVARSSYSYRPSFLNEKELERLNKITSKIPIIQSMDIVVLDPSAENGYPHTRPNSIICMPKRSITESSDSSLTETLCHEAMHVHQRRFYSLWSDACMHDGWTPISTEALPSDFIERCRLNPDTFNPQRFWAWETNTVPMPMYIRDDNPGLGDVQVKWLDIRNMTLFTDPPPSFSKRYGSSPPQPEHPFELLAVEFAAKKLKTDDEVRTKLKSI